MRLRKVCPQCNTVVHVMRSCCGCGHVFTLKRKEQVSADKSMGKAVKRRRALETVEDTLLTLGAHARGLQYLSCLCVCVCVCFPYSGTSRNQAYKQQYQRLQRDTGMKYKKGFFFKTLRSEVMASFTHLE